jgi:chromosome segregation ATPase
VSTRQPIDSVFQRAADELKSCVEHGGRPGSVERQLLEVSIRCVEAARFLASSGSIAGARQRIAATGGPAAAELELVVSRACAILGESTRVWSAAARRTGQLAEVARALEALAGDLRLRAAAATDNLDTDLAEIARLRARAEELGTKVEGAEADGHRMSEEVAALEHRLEDALRRAAPASDDRERVLAQIHAIEQLQAQCRATGDAVVRLETMLADCQTRGVELARTETNLKQRLAAETRDLEQAAVRLSATKSLVEELRNDPRAEISREVQKVWGALPADQFDRILRTRSSSGNPSPSGESEGS